MKIARPRFPGHQQPKVPLWGYEDEADPAVMSRKIDAAADSGISTFLFDWYYYNDGPFLERALREGFQKAPNANRLNYPIMTGRTVIRFPLTVLPCYFIPGLSPRKHSKE